MAEIKSIEELLKIRLSLPDYQRPYQWTIRNIRELLNDIETAIVERGKYTDFKYRIGTIIIHKNGEKKEIVDGQQRIITLTLISECIYSGLESSVLNCKFTNKISQTNIYNNYRFIEEWFSLKGKGKKEQFREAFKSILEAVMIYVDDISEAFQLFDSQNTRGKSLDPHDLLKAYHLREMKSSPYEMQYAVTKWEAKDVNNIRTLFDSYLFPIWNWSRKMKSSPFTAKAIYVYKGISENSTYTYAKRTVKAMPCFQITEPFVAGTDFFEMVEHYLYLRENIKSEIEKNASFKRINYILKCKEFNCSSGFKYATNLFYAALFCYYDKFHNFDEMAVTKLFLWAFMLRVDMENLGFDSINKYAIGGEDNTRYTNKIAMFAIINLARTHEEISSLQIKVKETPKNWSELYKKLQSFSRIEVGSNVQ